MTFPHPSSQKPGCRAKNGNGERDGTSVWPDCALRTIRGVPTFLRDGKPWFCWGVNRPILGEHYEAYEHLADAGLRHFHCEGTCTEDIYHPELRFWHGPGIYDGSAQDRHFSKLAKICGDALFQIRLYVGAPEWWLDAHPEECQVYSDGSRSREIQACGKRRLPSVASTLWHEEACRALERYCQWLVESGWSRRVFSFMVSYGITWEWGLLGSDGFLDYSEPMRSYFRSYLQRKYATEEALSLAWGRKVGFADAAIPGADRRGWQGGASGIRPVPEFQDVIDFQQVLSEANADLLLALATTAKEACDRKVLVGSAYGYTLTAREQTPFTGLYGPGGLQGGHHAFRRVLESGDVDFLASPFNYMNRALGSGLLLEHNPLASIHAHGKAFFDENDLYTHTGRTNNAQYSHISIGDAANLEETLAYLRLAFAQAVVRGKHAWLAELAGWQGAFKENYNDSGFLAEVRRLNDRADALLERDRTPAAEVCFVIDEKSVAHLSLDHTDFRDRVYKASVLWGHTGAPFDIVLLEDLLENRCRPYRLIVPACVKAPEAIRQLQSWLQKSGARAWWDATREWYPPLDLDALLHQMTQAGVHRYVTDGSTVWANASMVLVHVLAEGVRKVHFPLPCRGIEFFSGEQFDAPAGICDWPFEKYQTALFLMEKERN